MVKAKKSKSVLCSRTQYKCRKCGRLFLGSGRYRKWDELCEAIDNLNRTDEQIDFLVRLGGRPLKENSPFRHLRLGNTNYHQCLDESWGIGDLVGAERLIELPMKQGNIVQPKEEVDDNREPAESIS